MSEIIVRLLMGFCSQVAEEEEGLISEVEELTLEEDLIHRKSMKNTAISTLGREISIPSAGNYFNRWIINLREI